MIKIAVAGAAGRMGSRITALSKEYPELKLAGAFEKKGHSATGKDLGTITGIGETGVKLSDSLENVIDNADVIIDFTSPVSTMENIRLASKKRKAMVIGTTGLSKDEIKEIEILSKNIP
ncbi:MAG: 4-hydroxy-tetrahydrodipicolinate reductase, partial [Nitrospirota bacterium]